MASEKNKKDRLDFQAITKGLGFHPPRQKEELYSSLRNVLESASSSQAIQRIQQVPSLPGVPKTQIPSRPKEIKKETIVAAPEPASDVPVLETQPFQQSLGHLYLCKRMFAFVLDCAFNTSLCFGALFLASTQLGIDPSRLWTMDMAPMLVAFLLFFNWSVIAAQEIAFYTSVGKKMMGLMIEGTPSALFLRAFFFWVSVGAAGLGLILALFHPKKRTLHDSLVDVQPIEIAEL